MSLRFSAFGLMSLVCWLLPLLSRAATHHQMVASLDPQAHRIAATDRITLPATTSAPVKLGSCRVSVAFTLHSGLAPVIASPADATLLLLGREVIDSTHHLEAEHFSLSLPCDAHAFTLQYGGEIFHEVTDIENPYSRGSADSPGIISDDGVVLSSASYWYPRMENLQDNLVSFTLEASVPSGWTVVSQGEKVDSGAWQELKPQDDFYLIAARFSVYEKVAPSGVKLEAYLRNADPALAKRYLDATAGYLDRYSRLIAAYPYSKFALVENFWETGLGMPSFTLLGADIIRLPFILTTSYPHEILHNWWGNSVYVDYDKGNWCEGITVYMADHLMAEKVGDGGGYRRDLLQKFSDFVNAENDFPLSKFQQRVDAPTEAVGYGKSMMLFHMLRQQVGDDLFRKSFANFYAQNKFRKASYDSIRAALEETTSRSFVQEFGQWVERKGAPQLKPVSVSAAPEGSGYELNAQISQTQPAEPFELEIPIAVHLEGEAQAVQKTYRMTERLLTIKEAFPKRPVWFEVDPEFDVFRRLSKDEMPPVITMALGAPKTLMLLPSAASASSLASWRRFTELMEAALPRGAEGNPSVEVALDSDQKSIPRGEAVWVLGKENHFASAFTSLINDQVFHLTPDGVDLGGSHFDFADHSLLMMARDPGQDDQVWAFAATEAAPSFTALAEKIVHYGKYSYLAFASKDMSNVSKGSWTLKASSMSVPVIQSDGVPVRRQKGNLAPRQPLAD